MVFVRHQIPWIDYDMISKTKDTPPRFMKYIHEKIGVLLRHNNHFIGCVACKNRKTLFVYDSLLSYHVSDREQAMKEASRYLSNYWSVTMSFQLQLCDIQVTNSNDCGCLLYTSPSPRDS
eukprot:TRINITY_DN9090_c0_g1_i3.p1 TRINITY_DN9090_c0_g1~~TRINITY_DN9090_c0_g1_i3.p1  ORF type:complete len:120 (+),score=8.27 TRINITY_DN9090_c0_g1_i3:353-712(+)